MTDAKLKLIIEAYDKTKDAFESLDKAVKGIETSTRKASASGTAVLGKLKESWLGLSAAAYATWATIRKVMDLADKGAKAMQAEDAFNRTSASLHVNAAKMVEDMKKASSRTIDESHLMQKALQGMAQDVDPAKIPALFEAARVGAVKSGDDITNVADGLIDAIANQMPLSLRRFGLIAKDEMTAFNKAVSSGAENLNLLDLVLANAAIQQATMGVGAYNAAIGVQRFKTEVEELKENLGKGIIAGLEFLAGSMKTVASAGLLATAAIWKLIQAKQKFQAIVSWGAPKTAHEEAAKTAGEYAQADLDYAAGMMTGKRSLFGTSLENSQPKTQADLDAAAKKAEDDKNKILAEWKKLGDSQQIIEAQRTATQAQVQGFKSGLDVVKEGYKLEEAAAEERYRAGLESESAYIAEKQRLEKATLQETLDSLGKEKDATTAGYDAMIGASFKAEERKKLASEKDKELARIDGEIQKTKIDMQIAATQNEIDGIDRSRKLTEESSQEALSSLQEEIKLRGQLNSLREERGEITVAEATEDEIQGQRQILELQRKQIIEKINAGGLTEVEGAQLESQVVLIDKQLYSLQAVTAEELKQKNAVDTTVGKQRDLLAGTYKLREELAKSSGDYKTMYEMQAKTLEIERQRAREKVGKSAGYTQEDIDTVNRYYDEQIRHAEALQTPFGAISLGLKDVANKAKDTGTQLRESVENAFDGMTDALTDFVMTGKGSFKDLANSIIRDMIRIQLQQQVTGPLASGLGKLIGGLFASTSGQGGISGGSAVAGGYTGGSYAGFHSGGMGNEPTFFRIIPNLDLLPRHHKGLGPGERLAVTTDDESTMTPGQRRDFFRMAAQYGASDTAAQTPGEINVHLTINALDSRSVSQTLAQHKDEIVGLVNLAYNRRGQRGPLGR